MVNDSWPAAMFQVGLMAIRESVGAVGEGARIGELHRLHLREKLSSTALRASSSDLPG